MTATQTSQPAPKEKEVSDGYWVVEKMEMEGTAFSEEDMTGIFGSADSIMALAFDAEGTFDVVLFEDFIKGTYSGTPDALELDFAREIVKGTCTDDTLVLDMKDGAFTLKRQDKMPDMLASNPWVSYMPEFDAEQTATMSNFMSFGYYLIEDEVLYGLTHSQSADGSLGATPFHMKGDFPEFEEPAIPEGASNEEVEAAAKADVIKVRNGMMTDEPCVWQERDGELGANMGMSDEFVQFSGDGEFLTMATTRFERLQ